jgi:hypothetical protein
MANLLHTSQFITNTIDTLKTNQTALSEISHSLNNHMEILQSSPTTTTTTMLTIKHQLVKTSKASKTPSIKLSPP